MARFIFVGRVAPAIRRIDATVRAMQKPKEATDGMNLYPRFLFFWKIVIWPAAQARNMAIKTAETGTSTEIVARPPTPALVGRYGGPDGIPGGCRKTGQLGLQNIVQAQI